MDKVVIVGSGASGVHFALSLLKKGYQVIMLDVGFQQPKIPNPEDSFTDLKRNLKDPVEYFLGENYEAVVYPDSASEYYGFPPSKNYVFHKPSQFRMKSNGFSPLFSFAQGGLAQAWTCGVHPFNDQELKDFPFNYKHIEPYYNEVAQRIGISGAQDDLETFIPFHDNISEPLALDQHSKTLLDEYEKQKAYLNKKLNCYLGRSRIAALSKDAETRKACKYCGRCIWGCPIEALYVPSITLNECKKFPNFTYIPNIYISHFIFDSKHHVTSVVGQSLRRKKTFEIQLDKLVLAAGTLSTSKIFMESIYKNSGEIIKLNGLMDNRHIMIPFANAKMISAKYESETYQYHQLAIGIEGDRPEEYVHGQITTLKTASFHPVIQKMPPDLKTSIFMFRNIHAALGLMTVFLHDTRRSKNYVTLEIDGKSSNPKLVVTYSPATSEKQLTKRAVKRIQKALSRLRCLAPSSMIHVRPMGSGVHYAGTIPMSRSNSEYTVSEFCQSNDFDNLYIIDGAVFPFLPSKNLTLTSMAIALRAAETAF